MKDLESFFTEKRRIYMLYSNWREKILSRSTSRRTCGLLFKGKVKEIQKLRVCMKRPKNLFTIIISLIY